MAGDHADVVVVAAGASQRFGSDKLEAEVRGRPLLAWTLDHLAASPLVDRIVVVTAAERVGRLRSAPWLPAKVVDVVAGGARRRDSVAAGLEAVAALPSDDGAARTVLVHDGARPLVTPALIADVIDAVRARGAAIPTVAIAETVKRLDAHGRIVETVDRSALAAAQTPQGATLALLEEAFAAADPAVDFTDEAALLEACRIAVHAIPGDPTNLKVTLPTDLGRVEQALGGSQVATGPGTTGLRVGYGSDRHPFGPELGLALGGVTIAAAPRLHGHSDGDVLLHAIADAMLGAAGLGDLGRLFPAGPATPRGIASAELIAAVRQRVAAAGYAVRSLDCLVVGARPRLADRLPAMAARIADLLGTEASAVGVKASTGNLDGMEGTGRGISATAIVVLEPAPEAGRAATSGSGSGDR